ncbi:MAG: threonine--tRNA ligase [Holosporales bacterium]|jgi:threonyl-tRNA synthetase|nr:threonine--tRNA ligase [Holosporales bacterium]
MNIFLKDGSKIILPDGATARDVARDGGLEKKALVARIDRLPSKLVDLTTDLQDGDTVELVTSSDGDGLSVLRHSAAHVLALALSEIDPSMKFAIGPAIDDGFYYDVKSDVTFSTDDLNAIEHRMRKIIESDIPFVLSVMSKEEAIRHFSSNGQKYKVELIEGLEADTVSVYSIGGFMDLCRGPHIPSTGYIPQDAFKLTSVAGAYWRGDSRNDMLQRIYGTAFSTIEEKEAYFAMVEEAKLRDHRKLGPELEIFHIDESAPGSVFWLKNGYVIFNLLKDYISDVIRRHGYYLVQTPQLMDRSLWETSGHWEKFRENMFVVENGDSTMAIKPMNCPGHIICYKTGAVKSYRDLPIRMAEFGLCHRNESSGSMHGLMRLRAFMQDDGHIFCSEDQIISETIDVCSMIKEVYATFGFNDITVKFSDRPEKRVGSDEVWDIAERSLQEASEAAGLQYTVNKGEGAFYGPKLEFVLKDCLGRDWQCGTLQVDFNLPERFGISYTDSSGERKTPVMLHRAIVGSLERFIGILIEHYAGKFPFWLSPVQVVVANIADDNAEYAATVCSALKECGVRSILDVEYEKINYKIRKYSVCKIPLLAIVGRNEQADGTVSLRFLGSSDTRTVKLEEIGDTISQLFPDPRG